jgi:hypothetical protein
MHPSGRPSSSEVDKTSGSLREAEQSLNEILLLSRVFLAFFRTGRFGQPQSRATFPTQAFRRRSAAFSDVAGKDALLSQFVMDVQRQYWRAG